MDIPFERYAACGILQRLNKAFGPASGGAFPQRPPEANDFDLELQAGVQDGRRRPERSRLHLPLEAQMFRCTAVSELELLCTS